MRIPWHERPCVNCGKLYQPRSARQMWCSAEECQREKRRYQYLLRKDEPGRKERNREYYRRNEDRFRRYRREAKQRDPRMSLLHRARTRAQHANVPFAITPEDIVVPKVCPVLGIPLHFGKGMQEDGSMSLDRVVPHLGYVPGNVIVVSSLANRVKNSASPMQVCAVGKFYMDLIEEKGPKCDAS